LVRIPTSVRAKVEDQAAASIREQRERQRNGKRRGLGAGLPGAEREAFDRDPLAAVE
jgi:hypothetical protein